MQHLDKGTVTGLAAAIMICAHVFTATASPLTGLSSDAQPGEQADAVPDMAVARRAAETLALYGRDRGDPAMLLGSLEVLLATGATLEADDPWGAAAILDEFEALARGDIQLLALLSDLEARPRGALAGPIRDDLTLDPGATLRIEYLVAEGELMDVEVRLKHGSEGADLDLAAYDADGTEIANEAGPETGIIGIGAYIRFIPEECDHFTVEIRNTGNAPASFALVAARAITPDCE
jgi:hypothetical protein